MYLNNQIIVLANSKINCHRSAQMQTDMRNPKWFYTVRIYLINAYAMWLKALSSLGTENPKGQVTNSWQIFFYWK